MNDLVAPTTPFVMHSMRSVSAIPREGWAQHQLSPWASFAGADRAAPTIKAAAARCASIMIFEVQAGTVIVHAKGPDWPAIPGAQPFYDLMTFRAEMYRRFLQEAISFFGCEGEGVFAVDLDDLHGEEPDFPTFTFQKQRGSRRVLLPDIDSVTLNFYADDEYIDALEFRSKAHAGIFVGSTTGDLPLRGDHVAHLTNARLRAGVFFRDDEAVTFSLPNIVQCDRPQTAMAIKALSLDHGTFTWDQQFGHRYLISMDGNGATCARVAIALNSKSVLIKYASAHLLSYFVGLEPGLHYLPAASDVEVLEHIDHSRKACDLHQAIAVSSQRFFVENLARIHHLRYAADLLDGYFKIGRTPEAKVRERQRHHLEFAARFAPGRHQWRDRQGWARTLDNHPLTGLAFYGDDGLCSLDIVCRVAGDNDVWTRFHSGAFCALPDRRPIHRLHLRLKGFNRLRFHLSGTVIYADGGRVRLAAARRRHVRHSGPIIAVRVVASHRATWCGGAVKRVLSVLGEKIRKPKLTGSG